VDSEHSAIWQCLNGERDARRIILTASGGPFRSYTKAQMEKVTVAEALNHPSWRMGNKVTVDSATLMNKGLEIIEAHRLFGMAVEDIEVVIHPQSVIHSMVEFADGSLKAQLSRPDMRFPIQYALTYPARLPNPDLPKIDWAALGSLTFEAPDYDRFPCLRLAITAAKEGGICPAVLAAADEAAVALFLEERIGFTDIAAYVEKVLEKHQRITNPSLEEINAADAWARRTLNELAGVS
jgi:1-deoxy-D-xylulose-5-phosphate reductoisomerase